MNYVKAHEITKPNSTNKINKSIKRTRIIVYPTNLKVGAPLGREIIPINTSVKTPTCK